MVNFRLGLSSFARSGHMVRIKLCWDANNALGLPKQRNSYQCSDFPLFESPIALFASQHNLFRTMWPDRAKGLLLPVCIAIRLKRIPDKRFAWNSQKNRGVILNKLNILGQGFFEHACCFCASLGQDFPPCWGAGFVQVRVRISIPLPQDTLHGFATDQLDHPPGTK